MNIVADLELISERFPEFLSKGWLTPELQVAAWAILSDCINRADQLMMGIPEARCELEDKILRALYGGAESFEDDLIEEIDLILAALEIDNEEQFKLCDFYSHLIESRDLMPILE
jgi:hypothetical protein